MNTSEQLYKTNFQLIKTFVNVSRNSSLIQNLRDDHLLQNIFKKTNIMINHELLKMLDLEDM